MSAAALWYESKRAGLGAEFVAAVDLAFERIGDRPLASPVWQSGPIPSAFRRQVVRQFPFMIFFTVTADSIEVFAVAHAKRRPGYWMDR